MSGRPVVVGVTTSIEPVTHSLWVDDPCVCLSALYVAKVVAAGGIPFVIPPTIADRPTAEAVLDRVDALVITGGVDVDPAGYGAEPHPLVQKVQPERDATEVLLIDAAVRRDLPLLGICRGIQSMAVASGGTLVQHLPDVVGNDVHSPTPGRMGSHPVQVAAGSRLAGIVGDTLDVPTHHHQAVATHPGYTVVAHAEDGTIEAMEAPDACWRFAVQWHPEASTDGRLFAGLVAAAQAR